MNGDTVLSVGLVVVWFAVRMVTQRWAARRVQLGTMSIDAALFLNAATFATIPLLALPFRHSPSDIALLVGLSAFMFLGQLAFTKLLVRFIKGRS
jgi:hypothetical protein